MISKIVYLYHKKNRYLDSYIQDLIANKTTFKAHKIKLSYTEKKDNSEEFNYFLFDYNGSSYDMAIA